MNHCYRLVFNVATHIWQAVAETAKSHAKSCGKSAAVVLLPILILGISNVMADPAPNALPTGGQVVAGQSTITQNGNLLNIQQTTQKSIINWTTFNIGASSHVNYDQVNTSSISLNRVLSADPSAIFGKLTSNGQVWLINPNGILFGQSAQVNVGGILASTLNIADDDFLNSNYKFTGNTRSVVNMSSIIANNGGYVAMLAPEVRNEGVISALQGNASLAAGNAITLDFNGNGLINVQVNSANINTLVENKHLIKVGGGQVLMSSKAADGLITSVINNSGRIEADSMIADGGVVRLTGAKLVTNSGEISAQASEGKGGSVHMLGENVGVFGTGSIDTSSKTGGGTILVGGDLQGSNAEIQNANKTFISQDAKLTADATNTGDGGKVIVWADDITRYYGSISAKGGAVAGNGGFVEVSGKRLLNFLGNVDVSATQGVGGHLLLDPLNISLAGADTNTAGFTVPGDLTEAFADDAGLNSVFNVGAGGSFSGIAAGSTITLQATNNITISAAFNVATATGSANNSLVLQANNDISVNAAVTTTGTGAITMAANADGVGGGNVAIAANVSAQSGGVTLSGVNITRTAGDISSIGASGFNGGNINMTATGAIALGGATVSNNGGGMTAIVGNAGNINISAGTGFSMAGAIVSGGPASLGANSAGGNGGNVSITSATGNVSTGAITTNGGNAGAGIANGSNAGNISVVATTGDVTTGALTARTGLAAGTGASGAVASVSASGANVTLGAVDTSGQALSNGNGGTISANTSGILTLNGAINSSGGTVITGNAGKNAGAVNFTGNSIASVAAGTITASGSNGLGADQAGGNGAAVSLTATGAISARAITANGGNGAITNAAGGNAGSISIVTNTGNITTNAGALTARTGAGIGTGANSAQEFITVNNTSAAGTIDTGAINTSGQANGHGGNISVTSNGAVTVGGTVSSSGGTSTGTRAGRNAGNITITGVNRSITGAITASGGTGIGTNQAGGNAGVVSITGAGTLSTAAITTSTGARTGAGAGGVAGSITLSGSSIASTALSTAAGAGGVGGNVSVTTTGVTTSSIASINATTNGAISMNVADTLTVSGVITGTGTTLTKTGVGTLTLSGANTYTGVTTVNAGTVVVNNASALGTATAGTTVNASATLAMNGFTVASEALALNNATLSREAGNSIWNGTVALTGANTLTGAGGTLTLGGVVSGAGSLTKTGAGTVVLTGNNTYTGATNINAGTLQVAGGNGIGNSSAVTLANISGAILNLNGTNETIGSLAGGGVTGGNVTLGAGTLTTGANNTSTTYDGVISGTGVLTKIGTGTQTLSRANTYTGATNINAGTLVAANVAALGAAGGVTTVAIGATLNVNNITLTETAITLNTGGALTGTGAAGLNSTITAATNSTIGTTSAASALTLNGAVTGAGNLGIVGAGDVTAANAANNFSTVNINGAKNVSLRDSNSIIFGNGASSLIGNLTVQAGGNVTVNNNIATSGGDITLAGVNFINNAGASALSASGRWLVYANTHTGNTYGGLNNANQAIWNTAFPATVSQTGNRYVFANSPTVTVTSTNQVKTYGQNGVAIVANAFTATGFINAATFGDVFTQDTTANSLTGSATSTGSAVTANVGSYAIDVTPISAITGYTLTKNSTGLQTVDPASLTITANNQVKTYGQTFNFAGTEFTNSALQNGETVGSVSLASAGAVNTANVAGGSYAITASAATGGTFNANNYSINYVNGAMTVNPASLTITANNQIKTYGQTFNFMGTEFTSTGLQNSETIGSATLTSAGAVNIANVASYAITASAATGGTFNATNYAINYVNGTMTVNPAIIDLSGTRTYNGTTAFNPADFGAINGVLGQTLNLTGAGSVASANAGAAQTLTLGSLALSNGTGLAANYTLASGTHAGLINQANLTISTTEVTKTYNGNLAAAGTATVTSGLLFSNASNGNALDTISGGTFAYTNANAGIGNKTVTTTGVTLTDGNGGGNYNVTYADNTASTINKASLTISTTDVTKTYDGMTTAAGIATVTSGTLYNNASNGNALDNLAGGSFAYTNKNAGTGNKIVTVAGVIVNDGNSGDNYNVTYANSTTSTINKADISAVTGITANNKVYDATTAASLNTGAAAYTGMIGGDILTVTTATGAFVDANAATGKTVNIAGINLGGADSGNYNLLTTTASTTADINKAALSVTANDATKIQGKPNLAFSSVISGFVGGETSSVLIGALGHSTLATTISPSGSYAITPFGLSAANYDITFVDGVLLVNAPANLAAVGIRLNLALTRPEQALQTCGAESAGSAMISGLDAGADDVEYKESVSQPQIGGVVANALVSPACLKI